MNATELFQKYRTEIEEAVKIDQLNVKDVQLKLPFTKHFWVARLIEAKIDLNKLQKQKTELKNNLLKEIIEKSPVMISKKNALDMTETHSEIKKLTEEMYIQELLILYLEKVESTVLRNMSYDISNIIKLIVLETN